MISIAWERYKILGNILIDIQGQGAALLFYFTILVPFGIGVRLLGDPLRLKEPVQWVEREALTHTLEEARRQG